jgi:hypothetical protein
VSTHLVETVCTSCGVRVYSTPEQAGAAQCLECRRTAEGVDWVSSVPLGDWHPTVGYDRPLVWRERGPAAVEVAVWWGCGWCGMQGPAGSVALASAMIRAHEMYACPATASSREEFGLRLARHADLRRHSPEHVPPYTRPFRSRKP